MFDVVTYSPNDVVIDIAGFKVGGWVSITISKNTPSFQLVKGIRGKNTRVRSLDRSATIQIEILQTSIANDVFSEIVRQDNLSLSGKLELFIKHVGNKFYFGADCAFIEELAVAKFSGNIESKVWTIHVDGFTQYEAGGSSATTPFDFFSSSFGDIGKTVGEVSDKFTSLF